MPSILGFRMIDDTTSLGHTLNNMAMPAQQPEPLTLRQRYKALPQELQDQIHGYCFHWEKPSYMTRTTIIVDRDTKPLVELHIKRATRQFFIESYYKQTIFQFEDAALLRKFLLSVPRRYLRVIRQVRLDGGGALDQHEARAQATALFVSLPEETREVLSPDQVSTSYQVSPMAWMGSCWIHADPPDGLRGGEQAGLGCFFRCS